MFVSRERIAERGSTAWVNLRFANARKTMEEITMGDMECSNKSGVQEGGPCKCNDVSHVMIWDGVEHGEGIQEPFTTNVARGSWWQTDSYKLQKSYI